MHLFKTLSLCVLMSSGAAFAQDGGPGDPDDPGGSGDLHEEFDFISAWGMHPTDESGMALLPNENGGELNEHMLHDVYDVGVSFVNDDAPSPSFEGFGTMEGMRLWKLPAESAQTNIDLSNIRGADGTLEYEGSAVFIDLLFFGRLSTYTGYDQIVTGIISVSRFDFLHPEEEVFGSVLVIPLQQWESAEEAYETMCRKAEGFRKPTFMEPMPAVELGDEEPCVADLRFDKAICDANFLACRANAKTRFDLCMANIGFSDTLEAAATDGAVGSFCGAGIGLGYSWWTGVGVIPATAGFAAAGGVIGVAGGLIYGTADLKEACLNQWYADYDQCVTAYEQCKRRSWISFMRCRRSIE
ncbi:MAG: hypothetical protein CMJ67_07340 [Planctomycetaceae bacterium]|nr:hypothetical protein [Planctomycetaceae bacterium]